MALECLAPLLSLALEPCHGPDRASGAALDLQRKADEAEAALAQQLVQIDEPLHVRDAVIAANMMDLEIVAAGPTRTDGFDAEHANALPCKPGRRGLGQAWKVRQVALRAIGPPEKVHVEQDRVLRLDGEFCGGESLFKIGNGDIRFELLVRQVKANRLGEEGLERHLVDGFRTGSRIKMTGGVDMGACMIAHGKSKRGSREGVAIGFADLRVGGVGCDDYRGMVQQSRHLVVDVAAKVDEGHGMGSKAAVGEGRSAVQRTFHERDAEEPSTKRRRRQLDAGRAIAAEPSTVRDPASIIPAKVSRLPPV